MAKKTIVNPTKVWGGIYEIDGTISNFIEDMTDGGEELFQNLCKYRYPIFVNAENGVMFSTTIKSIEPNHIKISVNFPYNTEIIDDAIVEHCYYTTFIMQGDTNTGQYTGVSIDSANSYQYTKRYSVE